MTASKLLEELHKNSIFKYLILKCDNLNSEVASWTIKDQYLIIKVKNDEK